jgi:hypothetical protein
VKHLSPFRLQAAAEGQALRPAERAHLRACAGCAAEAEALAGLLQALQEAPQPARALDAAVMRRLGLAPQPRPSWRWAPLGLGVAAAAWLFIVAPPRPPQAPAPIPLPVNAPAPAPARCRRPEPPPSIAPRATPAVAPAPPALLDAAAQAPAPALGDLGPQTLATRPALAGGGVKDPGPPPPPPLVASVQNNLIKPGSGPLRVLLHLAQPGPLSAVIYDLRGRPVADLYHGDAAGDQALAWDGRDAASGTYLLMIHAGSQAQTVKLLVVR